ncbi:MAG: hypothetical protein PQJ61_10720 [Spirochaetales bacterium]|uniref:Outer membrane protein beta-barrel domain-containing protein n=1 Tax=Candidatus Thalassospirochaeta sargassi TaxID=3119039 RepID=A0AAJ1MJB2_9SPIO|nr:hypothetical protein [Spirochaetales bacterium]
MLKKLLIIMLMAICATSLWAADWSSNYKQGNVVMSVGAGFESSNIYEIAVYPAAEMILLKPEIGELSFIDLGAKLMVRGGIGFPALDLGAGLAGTLHFGLKDLADGEIGEYLDPIDFFAEVGVGFDFLSNAGIGLIVNSGVNYWLEKDFALGLKYTGWNSFDGVSISANWKFKNQKRAEKAVEKQLDS